MEEVVSSNKLCELCNVQAVLFCPSDSAFLCFQCDTKVHQANFLVARHLRFILCSQCNSLTKISFSLCSSPPCPALCPSCSRNNSSDDSDLDSVSSSSSSSSTRVSSTQSSQKINLSSSDRKQFTNIDSTGEVNSVTRCELPRSRSVKLRDPRVATCVFMHWCKMLGMDGEQGAVQKACNALGICFSRFRGLPLRVGLAACFWFGLRCKNDRSKSTWYSLKKLEEISGVPAKLILVKELKLRKIIVKANNRRHQGMEESWAESSP